MWTKALHSCSVCNSEKYTARKAVISAMTLVTRVAFYVWSFWNVIEEAIVYWNDLYSYPVPEDPCDSMIRSYEALLQLQIPFHTGFYAYYAIVDITAAFLMVTAIGDSEREDRWSFKVWLSTELVLMYYHIAYASILLTLGRRFNYEQYVLLLLCRLSLGGAFARWHCQSMQKCKTRMNEGQRIAAVYEMEDLQRHPVSID